MVKRYKWIVIGCAVLCMTACVKQNNTAKEQAPIRVKTMVVVPQSDAATSRYVGTIEPIRETPLSMQTTGRVTMIQVKNGERVRKGQVLVEVDNTQALNALRGAEATLQHAQDGYTRAKQVHDKGVISDQKMVEIESELAQAKSLYSAAKQQVEECKLVAPCEGLVNGLELTKGQSVLPGVKICSILDVSGFCVRFTVPESEINLFRGENVDIKGSVECAAVDKVFPIKITEKSVTANPVTHTYDVVARIQGGADVLMTGMVAKVKVKEQRAEERGKQPNEDIVIPARCVLLKPEGHTVWVIENGEAVRRDVALDGYQADGVRVLSGLQPGDTLIIDGYQKLYIGCKVIED